MPRSYFVNEGNHIGGQEAQALGTAVSRVKASAKIVKGNLLEVSGPWTVAPASDKSAKVVGVAFGDAEIGDTVVIETEGFVKLDATNAAITAGDKIVAGGSGLVRTFVSANDGSAVIVGVAYDSCAANGIVYTKLTLS